MQSFHYYYCLCNTSSCFKPRRKTQYTIWWSTVWPHASGILQFMYIIHGHTNKWLLFCYTFTAKNNSVDITHKFGDIANGILMFMRFLFPMTKKKYINVKTWTIVLQTIDLFLLLDQKRNLVLTISSFPRPDTTRFLLVEMCQKISSTTSKYKW